MAVLLEMQAGTFPAIVSHLLRPDHWLEEAAFLFARPAVSGDLLTMNVLEVDLLEESAFETQESEYLELKDETRAALIRRAHALSACLIELHSHPGPWPAMFSPADLQGLSETVPHMHWRLPGRPYTALVIARSGFDALVWPVPNGPAVALTELRDGNSSYAPTNNTLRHLT